MSVSAKLADYDQTKELLGRLKTNELRELAKKNDIALEKEDTSGKIRRARGKSEIAEMLVESEFNESDLIELLGISRMTKDELLNQMRVTQLKQLAKETGVVLEKSSIFGTKKASKKEDIVDALGVLSTSKVREYAEKVSLIKKPTEKTGRKVAAAKVAARKRTRKESPPEKPAAKKLLEPSDEKRVLKAAVPSKRRRAREEPGETTLAQPPRRISEGAGRIIEETIRETVTEREIVRRRASMGMSDDEILRALESAAFEGPRKEREYEAQLSRWLQEKGVPSEHEKPRKRGGLDLVLSENDTALELKPVRTQRGLDRLAGRIHRYKDRYRKVFVIIMDELQDPDMMEKEAERIEKMDPEKIKVIVKKAKKK